MDISLDYQLMCVKAVELQLLKTQHNFGDYILHEHKISIVNGFSLNEGKNQYRIAILIDDDYDEKWFDDDCINTGAMWLPRQDDLQEILFKYQANKGSDHTNVHYRICYDNEGKILSVDDQEDETNSLEQYWLINVMFYCYNKKWNKSTGQWEQASL